MDKPPASTIRWSLPKEIVKSDQVFFYYLHQNLSTFLHRPNYQSSRPECRFRKWEIGEGRSGAEAFPIDSVFIYCKAPITGSEGIACVAFTVVQASGAEGDELTATADLSVSDLCVVRDVGVATALADDTPHVIFQAWKRGNVDLEKLATDLKKVVQDSLIDSFMESHVLLTPFSEVTVTGIDQDVGVGDDGGDGVRSDEESDPELKEWTIVTLETLKQGTVQKCFYLTCPILSVSQVLFVDEAYLGGTRFKRKIQSARVRHRVSQKHIEELRR